MNKKSYDRILGKNLLHRHDPLFLTSDNGTEWVVTVDDGGNLIISGPPPEAHSPMGLLVCLTYPSAH